jgi:cysteine sulfinate desulfinase/cysteine desulfurase-like protein
LQFVDSLASAATFNISMNSTDPAVTANSTNGMYGDSGGSNMTDAAVAAAVVSACRSSAALELNALPFKPEAVKMQVRVCCS